MGPTSALLTCNEAVAAAVGKLAARAQGRGGCRQTHGGRPHASGRPVVRRSAHAVPEKAEGSLVARTVLRLGSAGQSLLFHLSFGSIGVACY